MLGRFMDVPVDMRVYRLSRAISIAAWLFVPNTAERMRSVDEGTQAPIRGTAIDAIARGATVSLRAHWVSVAIVVSVVIVVGGVATIALVWLLTSMVIGRDHARTVRDATNTRPIPIPTPNRCGYSKSMRFVPCRAPTSCRCMWCANLSASVRISTSKSCFASGRSIATMWSTVWFKAAEVEHHQCVAICG